MWRFRTGQGETVSVDSVNTMPGHVDGHDRGWLASVSLPTKIVAALAGVLTWHESGLKMIGAPTLVETLRIREGGSLCRFVAVHRHANAAVERARACLGKGISGGAH